MTITLKETNIVITCKTGDEAYRLYWGLGHYFTFVMADGRELEKSGRREDGSLWGGYTREFFEKFED